MVTDHAAKYVETCCIFAPVHLQELSYAVEATSSPWKILCLQRYGGSRRLTEKQCMEVFPSLQGRWPVQMVMKALEMRPMQLSGAYLSSLACLKPSSWRFSKAHRAQFIQAYRRLTDEQCMEVFPSHRERWRVRTVVEALETYPTQTIRGVAQLIGMSKTRVYETLRDAFSKLFVTVEELPLLPNI